MNEIIDSEEGDNDDKEDSSKQALDFKYRSGKIRPHFRIENKRLLPFIKINSNEESKQRFVCTICNRLYREKMICLKHLNNFHHDEVISIITKPDYKPETNMLSYDCKNRTCRELYGPKHGSYFDLWCKKCTDMARQGQALCLDRELLEVFRNL